MVEAERLAVILDAAYACFTRHGMRRTTMDDIARAAGISRAGVYQYVRNKEDAFRRLVERLTGEVLARARAAAAQDGPLTDRLTAVLAAKLALTVQVWKDSPAHAAELLGSESRHGAAEIEAYDTAMRTLVAGMLPGGRRAATDLAAVLLALVRGLEIDLTDAAAANRRLRKAVALFVAGLDTTLEQR
jgi:TetR/AcrR family transcriptional regulator